MMWAVFWRLKSWSLTKVMACGAVTKEVAFAKTKGYFGGEEFVMIRCFQALSARVAEVSTLFPRNIFASNATLLKKSPG